MGEKPRNPKDPDSAGRRSGAPHRSVSTKRTGRTKVTPSPPTASPNGSTDAPWAVAAPQGAVAHIDPSDHTILNVNSAALTLLGLDRHEVVGRSLAQLGAPPARAVGSASAVVKPWRVVRPDGTVRDIRLMSAGDTLSSAHMIVFQDVSDQLRAERQLAQLRRLYSTLSQMNLAIASARRPVDLYQFVCDIAVRYGACQLAWVSLVDAGTGDVRPTAASGLDVAHWPFAISNVRSPESQSDLSVTALRTGQVAASVDIQANGHLQNRFPEIRQFDYRAAAAIPFRRRGQTVGVIGLVLSEAGLFDTAEELQLLEQLGGVVTFAIDALETEAERARAQERADAQSRRLRILADASQAFASVGNDYQAMLQAVVQLIADTLGDTCSLRLISADGEWLELVASHSVDPRIVMALQEVSVSAPERLDGDALVSRVARTGESVLIPVATPDQVQAAISPELWARLEPLAYHSVIAVAPRIHGRPIGAMLLSRFRREQPAFTDNDLHLAENLADRAALALANARLLDQVQGELAERRRIEAALAASEKRYRALIEAGSDLIVLVDRHGTVQYVSPAVVRALGYTTAETRGRNGLDLVHPDDLLVMQASLADLIGTPGRRVPIEFRLRHQDGNWRWLAGVGTNMLDDDDVQGVVLNLLDVTERRRAIDALRRSESTLRMFIDHAPAALAMFDQNMCYLAASRRWVTQYELTDIEIIGRSHYELFPELPERWREAHRRCLAGESIDADEDTFVRANGAVQWLRWKIRPWFADAATVGGIMIFSEDLTAHKNAEAQIRYQARLIDNVSDAIISTDTDQRVRTWNSAAEAIYGWAASEAVGRPVGDILATQYQNDAHSSALMQLDRDGQWKGDVIQRRRDGTTLNIQSAVSLVRDSEDLGTGLVAVNRNITDRVRAERQVQAQLQRLRALRTIDLVITSSVDLRVMLDVVVEQALSELGVDAAAVLLLNAPLNLLEYVVGRGFKSNILHAAPLMLGQGCAGRAALERRLVHFTDRTPLADDLVCNELLQNEGFVTYYGLPLIAKGTVKGVLEVFHRRPLDPEPDVLDFFSALAGQAAIAIDSAQMFTGLQRSNDDLVLAYDATIEGWSRAMDLRDRETEGHTRRVTDFTLALARAAGLTGQVLTHVRRGALLHDIGKLGVPDAILFKPGPLNAEEWVMMRRHPQYAHDMLASIPYLQPALDIPYAHHERWDGTGYPRGLSGAQIPLAARLFAVVDVWDALRSDRPYRAAWSDDRVNAFLREQAGAQFDPSAVALFFDVLARRAPEEPSGTHDVG